MSETSAEIQALFNRIAPVYDRLNDRLSFGLHRVWKKMAVKWLDLSPGQSGLDICCGSGDLARLLARVVGGQGCVVGLDFAPAQLAIARERSGLYPQIQWHEGDALALPFPSHAFDGITMGYGLRNLTNIPRALGEMQRVLKPGGKVAILDFCQPQAPWLKEFQAWYLDTLVVPTAEQYGLKEDYAYLMPSLQRFPPPQQLIEYSQEAGFSNATAYPIAAGLMMVLVLRC
ncbi:bifunctional demethylmenaquinone methyltransferase/2-methoxy-6-polyprenyl-1,4-benzoquinol methylase UbiE [Candidatus Synechococcus calcipolaris G9]|uniref:2-phytyl-1,4-naphtoquinone methyltransferase n=1 Tax=Candidatus Synechococcus calcipolaris G9 TaxID=1497997 RepID=A0ABT6F2R2_9SYNE|nr:bifunctional demethylmenaquinone methyltransferase/2-methoxy-6-polyprenyl-1,4-benzoquinol methylase UbiE [Candidatus Synechococcus calcipolaris]MDG2992071.1 bifunctional demethylmenaquinone methyltransferase/2-methoxy-6-polyprenyl-1,4-benzoquinol methylase UbiE [Candidatus Synechococcus calcipolaris G9]